jgi:hypothetical protein
MQRLILLAVFGGTAMTAAPGHYSIQRQDQGWRLCQDGRPLLIQGAVGWTQLDQLTAAGANAVRIGANEKQLDQARRLGLGALVGLPLGIPRAGFDYGDPAKVTAQRERIRQLVLQLREHPAVWLWAIGNEPTIFTPPDQRERLWKEVNRIAEMIRSLDPHHPVIAVVGGEQWQDHLGELDAFCPALDAVGLNAYADMLALPEALARQGWKRPYLITEFGPRGHWQVERNAWKARLEDSSTAKAAFYRQAYEHAVKDRPQCLGSFAFLWAWKMEKTHTWYGMFLEDGSRTAAVDVMTHLWRGQWPTNRCPALALIPIELTGAEAGDALAGGAFKAGATLRCRVRASDPEGDALKMTWDLRRDVADDPRVGGDHEPLEPSLPGAVVESDGDRATIRLPGSPGKYRVFVYARDGHGGAATANLPVLTQ